MKNLKIPNFYILLHAARYDFFYKNLGASKLSFLQLTSVVVREKY